MNVNTDKSQQTQPSRSTRKEHHNVEMDRVWRPIFEKYDSDHDGWIPLDELKVLLQSDASEISNDFPEGVLDEILERADWDNDRMLSYEEFLRMVHAMELGLARPKFQRLVRIVAMTVVPKSERATTVRKYLEQYSCMPPPLFMIIASLGEFPHLQPLSSQRGLEVHHLHAYSCWGCSHLFQHHDSVVAGDSSGDGAQVVESGTSVFRWWTSGIFDFITI
ncbi:rhomboid-related protein 3-like isoform X2 [Limulus polyphemus]|uniref:Rhomboid-related protein 3-like isoform X2 n=1 Tax=Limulus polyphemus TaxID=6850 RepID=A0ABM1TNQ3_LIMPO|nr:rhomboid-related protein 3-like isoform X2 [Limulus polyphemus]